ncbi:glycosyltransferase family 2 protein [uncultured Methanobacterium sp.]|uniref:glycosyltransferase family 2 protein n=1 Tax=uncultured Methanobacterium sp. TaxID=176306 RepID=UPI002AA84525|nr:glycosyltransferase family 2 protein [uncultured Methanobacterium sp.]
MNQIKTSVLIVNTNQKDYIKNCLKSLKSVYDNTDFEIIIVDNDSTDGSPEFVGENYPDVKLIRTKNKGFCAANNLGAKNAEGEYLILLNPDTKVFKGSLEELVRNLDGKEKTISVPKILLYDGQSINTVGIINHFTGLGFTKGLGENIDKYTEQEYMSSISGACFCIRMQDFLDLGGLDEQFFLYMDDAEFSWRLKSKGYKVVYVPNAVICHDYTLRVPAEKIYYLEIGRYIILKKYFTWKEFLLFLPSLFTTELFTFGYSILKGRSGIKFKLKAIKEGLTLNVEKDNVDRKDLVRLLDYKIPNKQLNSTFFDIIFFKIGNFIYFMNYKSILIIWNL